MSFTVKRGDIFFADLGKREGFVISGVRPVVVIQNDIGNQYTPTVIVAAITSNLTIAKSPIHIGILSGNFGLPVDSIILLEQIFTLDKNKLIKKIGTVNDEVLEKIENALSISLGVRKGTASVENQELEKYKTQLTKPLVITEGKTDVIIIKTAWQKLFPKEQMFFECQSSGIEYNEDEREGNAEHVRKELEYLSNTTDRPIIGLFDNDREGNEQFKSLSKKIFEKYDIKKSIRKHIHNNVWGMLLPVPDERKLFVTEEDITQRYLVIEHYFSDDILRRHSMYGRNILGTPVFKINNRKKEFALETKELEPKEFENFKLLFEKIKDIFSSIT
ncbi:type II toxin-antitoxin system PemK/MazF family toxin [Acetivibrio thermocellus]|uniref:type II toxin-antitoxin system PemK/MazF family toxin n=1 Tax=Acetivibrio thermocellus TaxID=1515 RepID=UPI0010A640A8|nr:type II toxin-antitoxin system PemK/MazF family toxin [Acetivibrio thermocellus]THJ76962.1 type II toxin-antitoxin system PemK/MazF family toxin [Acetivibrio thermocellus]